MKTPSDSGHVKNVSNFELLVTKCESSGSNYNPSVPQLSLENLKTKAKSGREALSTYNTAQPPQDSRT